MRSLLGSVLLLAVAAHAQDPTPAEAAAKARELLRADDPAQRAWGAHWAVVSGDEELTPELLRAFVGLRGAEDRSRLTRRFIATALVDLRAEVPPAELGRLAREFPREALCIAVLDPKRYQGVLEEMLETELDGNAWTAAVELLLPNDSTALTAHLLRELETRLIVRVIDPDGQYSVGASSMAFHADEAIEVPGDYPPLLAVSLAQPIDGTSPLVVGIERVCVQRTEVAPGTSAKLRHLQRGPVAQRLKHYVYLRHLASRDVPGFVEHSGHVVAWEDVESYLGELDALRAGKVEAWKAALDDLVAEHHLDPAVAAQLPPRISWVIEDVRTKKDPALPPPPAVMGEQVRIGSIYWHVDYDAALALARERKKPLLLHFGENPG